MVLVVGGWSVIEPFHKLSTSITTTERLPTIRAKESFQGGIGKIRISLILEKELEEGEEDTLWW